MSDQHSPGGTGTRLVPCPTCSAPAAIVSSNKWRPFCSERCRQIDLGAWASERYRVPAKPGGGSDPGDPSSAPGGLNH